MSEEDTQDVGFPGGFTPIVNTAPAPVWVSTPAVLGLILGVIGTCAALTGLLAPEGLVVGAAGILLGVAGVFGAGRPGMAGRGVAGVGIGFSVVAVALALVAMSGRYSWFNNDTSTIEAWHEWLARRWPWLGRG